MYSISDMAQLSGISVHNIRMWERRYSVIQPDRSSGNTRNYNDAELMRLLQVAGLYHAGYKISSICALSQQETLTLLQERAVNPAAADKKENAYITQLVAGAMAYDDLQVNTLITAAFKSFGVVETYKKIIYPLLTRIGLLWLGESMCLSQEHFLSSMIRQKLLAAIDSCPGPKANSQTWLLFLPENEDHDIGLLLASYLLREKRQRVIYLGAKVPFPALANTIAATRPENLLFFITRLRPETEAQQYLNQLAAAHPAQRIYLAGSPRLLKTLNYPKGCRGLLGLADFELLTEHETNL